jgi:hypothetical protein
MTMRRHPWVCEYCFTLLWADRLPSTWQFLWQFITWRPKPRAPSNQTGQMARPSRLGTPRIASAVGAST